MADQATHLQVVGKLELDQLKRLEILSIIEATTLLLLLGVAVPLKHVFGWPLGSQILGPVHGLVFLVYLWGVMQVMAGGGWRWVEMVRLFMIALIPFGGFFNLPLLRHRAAQLRGMAQPS
ncbi:integral membrane protein [Chitinivorax tropicus]|uniref:Integral membrane protein n=1 Tax=Chitinivorax tropicus TaxID=714531 RepID=A0A840MNC7_9PROT|nr:DUF3817 domain-containing protein [Chitinivorax tropicus]MBB5018975.1 integral membrane protein [Chitinivorax tropicus]